MEIIDTEILLGDDGEFCMEEVKALIGRFVRNPHQTVWNSHPFKVAVVGDANEWWNKQLIGTGEKKQGQHGGFKSARFHQGGIVAFAVLVRADCRIVR